MDERHERDARRTADGLPGHVGAGLPVLPLRRPACGIRLWRVGVRVRAFAEDGTLYVTVVDMEENQGASGKLLKITGGL